VEIVAAPVTPAAEEIKTAAPVPQKPAPAATIAVPVKKAPVEAEEVDEEDMYGEGTTFAGVQEENDGFQVEEGKQMTETLVVFERN